MVVVIFFRAGISSVGTWGLADWKGMKLRIVINEDDWRVRRARLLHFPPSVRLLSCCVSPKDKVTYFYDERCAAAKKM